jgi:hypothetical protein
MNTKLRINVEHFLMPEVTSLTPLQFMATVIANE